LLAVHISGAELGNLIRVKILI